jgi:hypothetical protein
VSRIIRDGLRGPALVASLALLALLPRPDAGAAEGDDRRRATELLHQGAQFYERGDYQAALARFEQAYAVVPSAKIHFNLGQTLQALARPVEAIAAYERFLVEATGAPADARATAERALGELRGKVAALHVRCDVAGADVSVDGRSHGQTPLARPILLAAGPHQVIVEKAGLPLYAQKVTAAEGATLPLEVRLARATTAVSGDAPVAARAAAPPADPGPPPPRPRWTTGQKVGLGLMVAAAPIAGTGLVLGHRARADNAEIKEKCMDTTTTCMIDDFRERDERNKRDIRLQNILLGVGGAVLAGGALLVFLGGSDHEGDAVALSLTPAVSGGLLSVAGTFR